jgi:HEAT repeat protein
MPEPLTVQQERELRFRAAEAVKRAVQYRHAGSIRAQGIEVLQRRLPEAAPAWIRLALDDPEPGVQFAAILALGKLEDEHARRHIVKFVDDPDASLRVAAYFALHRLGDTSYTALLPELLLEHDEPAVRRNAAFVLGLLGEPGAVKLLAKAMDDEDESVGRQALESMAKLGNQEAINHLTYWANSGEGAIRVRSLNVLAGLVRPSLKGTFLYKLQQGEYLEVRLVAARGLGLLGDNVGFKLALRSLDFDRPQTDVRDDPPRDQIMRVRQLAARALGAIGDRRALRPLRDQLNGSDDPRVQLAAADAILEIVEPDTGGGSPWKQEQSSSGEGAGP